VAAEGGVGGSGMLAICCEEFSIDSWGMSWRREG
jgi:hypothetical protein